MNRRDALKNTGLFLGLGLAGGAVSSTLFQSCKDAQNMSAAVWSPSFIPANLVDMVAEITETILPRTETPGAKDVNVHQFLDTAWNLLYKPEEKEHIMKGLMAFDGTCKSQTGKSFMDLTTDERTAHLLSVELAAKKEQAEMWKANPLPTIDRSKLRQEPADQPIRLQPFWNYVKGNTLRGYFTSEEVGENVLSYLPVPGQYIDCMDLDPEMKIYSL